MSNSGGFALTRTHGTDRFYNPPPVRRHQQLLLQQQRQLRRAVKSVNRVESGEAETRTDSDESTLSRPNSACSSSPPRQADLTNLDRVMESVTPFVPAQFFSETRGKGWRTREADIHPSFTLGNLWESFREWSVYGVGVPLLLNANDSVKQYFVPYLSGIQLYIDPHRLRKPGEDSDAESSRETSSAGSSDCEPERRAKSVVDGMRGPHNPMTLNSQRMSRLTLSDKPPLNSSSDEAEVCSPPGLLVFEYFEQEQPHHRPPLFDKAGPFSLRFVYFIHFLCLDLGACWILLCPCPHPHPQVSNLASQFPELRLYKSCDLLPASWLSVAWYPIYRIPVGPTLQSLDASFLTFHSLSTNSRIKNQPQFHASSGRMVYGVDSSSKISLPVFGLASYKLRGSILTPSGAYECQQANSLLQAADNWLRRLQVNLPDFQFFVSHNSQWR
ncbi:uncharacterized protein LOC133883061 [Alnus glutinosa]|uniref:uncharacterized protein LOC133883061 n=1 Tax=Alnus glutinosa TaxID=3517 RepID=UPI002D76713B|nr:uncharacterized protein LOC133883061 [Alnus glutinosa]